MNEPKRRRTEITIETHRLTIVRVRKEATNSFYCRICASDSVIFDLSEAALIFGVAYQPLVELFQNGHIHRAGENTVCGNSLADYFNREIRFSGDG